MWGWNEIEGLNKLEDWAYLTDPEACWSFDDFAVWRHTETGVLYYGQDSGCSCPSPFEEVRSLEDLNKIETKKDLDTFFADLRDHTYCDGTEKVRLIARVVQYMQGRV